MSELPDYCGYCNDGMLTCPFCKTSYRVMSEWISVKDRFPKEEQPVLVYTGEGKQKRWWHFTVTVFRYGKFHVSLKDNVSHWMPLPEPPRGEE